MLFQKCGYLVGPENRIFRKLISVDPKKKALTKEMNFCSYFHFKWIPERERERESVRGRRTHSPSSSPLRSQAPASSIVIWDCDLTPLIAISPSRRRSRSCLRVDRNRRVISQDRVVHHDLAFTSIAILRSGAVLREIAIDDVVVRLELAKHRAVEPSQASSVNLGFVRVFLDLSFPSSFPNTRKYFSKNLWKCNQTLENIFLSEK